MRNICEHLELVPDTVNNYHLLLAYYVTCIADNAFKRKATDVHCHVCKLNNRIHACLKCAFFGCFDLESRVVCHMKDHAKRNDHCFAININYGALFCFKCDDYIYNEIFENIYNDYKLEAIKTGSCQTILPWKPNLEEIAVVKEKIRKISDNSYIGLRGIVNIGNSCYVNSIIQVLVHNPILIDFFLCDKHKCFLENSCLMCEMFALFQEFYSGITVPFNPLGRFFDALQPFCDKALGINEYDTYVLYQEILVGLCSCYQENHKMDDCNCMIHQTFYGFIQESTECSKCEAISLLRPYSFIDILLNLDEEDDTLVKLLNRRFLKPQPLIDHKCSSCENIESEQIASKQTATTRLFQTIKKLPTVICFRMNCHKTETKTTKKNKKVESTTTINKKSTAFTFEEWVNMSPYLNSKSDMMSNGNNSSNLHADENRYKLFALVSHKGKIDNGHYAAYVRHLRNGWFECNDDLIYKRTFQEVSLCQPILLFYYKQL